MHNELDHGMSSGAEQPQESMGHKSQEKLMLSLKAKDLSNVAGVFKGISDPYATVTIFSYRSHNPVLLGKTEVVKNSLNPDWVKTFPLDYVLGSSMNVVINLFDEVRKSKNISMGSASFDVSKLLGAPGNTLAVKMKKGGKVIVRVSTPKGSGTLSLQLSGSKLKNVESGMFGKSDPFFQLMRKDMGAKGFEWNTVYRSNYVKDNLNPDWKADTIPLSSLCGGDLDAPLLLTVFDNERDGNHTHMGQVETTVNSILNSVGKTGFYLMNKKGKNVGNLVVRVAEVSGIESRNQSSLESGMANIHVAPSAPQMPMPGPPMVASSNPMPHNPMGTSYSPAMHAPFGVLPPSLPSFADYISGGCEMQLCVAIDFTGSNGDPRKPGTLHYLNPNAKNDYEKAISAIGGVLADFDTDKKFPVWGFGAKYSGNVYHLFQCGPTAEVNGVAGILEAYHQTFKSGLVMSSPTVVTQVIDTAASFARKGQQEAQSEGKIKYSILLILTDGAVSDINATIASLRAASDAPLSIVVVGIGNADFSAMQNLDDLGSCTDILQFVEFNAHKNDANSLTQATLNEIPDQLVGYFQRNGIQPPPPVQVAEEEIQVEAQEEEIDLNFNFRSNGNISVSGGMFVPGQIY